MDSNVTLNPFSKEVGVIELKFTTSEFNLLIFEGEEEYKRGANGNDVIGGNIIELFRNGQDCFIRDILWRVKQGNPKAMFFIMRKRGL